MNATATGVPELTCQLLDAADGIPADTAAAALIISHGHFLHRDAFGRTITASASISTGQLPCASSEQAILRIAASLGDPAIGVQLRTVLGNLDARNITLVTSAITTANG
jgi:hypothetical protein